MKARRPSKAGSKSTWSLSRRVSPVLGEIMLDLLHQAYGVKGRATEIPSERGILLQRMCESTPPRLPQWKRLRLGPVDLARNNALGAPLLIGKRWMIIPPGAPRPATRRLCICIRPGMGFGSGDHETTALCLKLLETIPSGAKTLLDVGTGSGILAIAASKLGIRKIVGIENDPKALKNARRSARLNPESKEIQWISEDLVRWKARKRFDVVLANLLSGILVSHASKLASRLAPGGRLIVSGFLRKDQNEVKKAFQRQGLSVEPQRLRCRRFSCAVFHKPNPRDGKDQRH